MIGVYALLALLLLVKNGVADEVKIFREGRESTLIGTILVETQNDNGVLFQTRDGKLWVLEADEIREKTKSSNPVEPFSKKEMANQLKSELGEQFRIHDAKQFVIAYNTEQAYARWVAGLYRRLERGFQRYWKKFKLSDPDFPLAIIILKSRADFERHMMKDIGVVNAGMLAYYNLETNRVVMFDLTADRVAPGQKLDDRRINDVLNNPRAIPMVATIIHEGTHQLMFNYGMQARFSDTPKWLNEGLAMYFETPDLSASRGWGAIGKVNFLRYPGVLQYLNRRPRGALATMIASDDTFAGPSAIDSYSHAWAFNYFLLNKHKPTFFEYLKFMSEKPRLIYDTPEQRLEDFQRFFTMDLQELDREFVRYIRSLNR